MVVAVAQESEREHVINYLWRRARAAFEIGDDLQAQSVFRFMERLEVMDDDEFDKIYGDDDA